MKFNNASRARDEADRAHGVEQRRHPGRGPIAGRFAQRQGARWTISTTWATVACVDVGELAENQYRTGLVAHQKRRQGTLGSGGAIDLAKMPQNDLINAKPAAARRTSSSSQLSQFMDQTNPLAEITHKRRVSALGPAV